VGLCEAPIALPAIGDAIVFVMMPTVLLYVHEVVNAAMNGQDSSAGE
jgi:hypothetical protein